MMNKSIYDRSMDEADNMWWRQQQDLRYRNAERDREEQMARGLRQEGYGREDLLRTEDARRFDAGLASRNSLLQMIPQMFGGQSQFSGQQPQMSGGQQPQWTGGQQPPMFGMGNNMNSFNNYLAKLLGSR